MNRDSKATSKLLRLPPLQKDQEQAQTDKFERFKNTSIFEKCQDADKQNTPTGVGVFWWRCEHDNGDMTSFRTSPL
jgi:hypothetical protein